MFEMAEQGSRLSKEEYEREVAELRPALLDIEQRLRERRNLAVVILLGGVEGAGKSETVNALTGWFDPRGVEVNAFGPDDESLGRPPFYRYWMHLPPRGKIGIFFGSWYTQPIVDCALKKACKADFPRELERIVTFERHLAAENVLLIKFWLHLSRKAQEERLRRLRKDPAKNWRLTQIEKDYFKVYDRFYRVSEDALRVTSTGDAPWHVVEAADRRFREVTVARTIIETVTDRLDEPERPRPEPMPVPKRGPRTVLDSVDLTARLDDDAYEAKLQRLQGEVHELGWQTFQREISTVMVFEGWDAAGKGGAIKRLTQGLDARNYRVVSIAAPTEEERVKPYLWRFWRQLPPAGRMTIFDRSWYGRVLVERVEGFCRPDDWQRAFAEINDFESQLAAAGTLVLKFWLHLTQREQMRRFKEREQIAFKRFKITEEDWRNRSKWNAYLVAADEMFSRTSTRYAPWTLVPAEDKRIARLMVLETFRSRLKEALKKSRRQPKWVELH